MEEKHRESLFSFFIIIIIQTKAFISAHASTEAQRIFALQPPSPSTTSGTRASDVAPLSELLSQRSMNSSSSSKVFTLDRYKIIALLLL